MKQLIEKWKVDVKGSVFPKFYKFCFLYLREDKKVMGSHCQDPFHFSLCRDQRGSDGVGIFQSGETVEVVSEVERYFLSFFGIVSG